MTAENYYDLNLFCSNDVTIIDVLKKIKTVNITIVTNSKYSKAFCENSLKKFTFVNPQCLYENFDYTNVDHIIVDMSVTNNDLNTFKSIILNRDIYQIAVSIIGYPDRLYPVWLQFDKVINL